MRHIGLAFSLLLLSNTFAFAQDDAEDPSLDAGRTVQEDGRDMGNDRPSWDKRIIDWAFDKNEDEHPELKKDQE